MPESTLRATAREQVITSPTNPAVKALVRLRERRERDRHGVTVVEGYDELALAVAAGAEVREIYYCRDLVDPERSGLLGTVELRGVRRVVLGSKAFGRASYRDSPDGWLAVVTTPGCPVRELLLRDRPLVLVAESVEKPGNLGAMLRTADAVGVDAVVAADAGTDWGNPNLVRASKGTVFAIPVAAAPTAEAIEWLAERQLRVVVATPDGDRDIFDVDLTGPTAVVVGAEHAGVSAAWHGAAAHRVRIPMTGRINSLNVSVAAAVVLFEALRQRAHS